MIGAGAFGRNHARVYDKLAKQGEAVRLAGIVDTDLARADVLAKEFGCRAFGSIEQLTATYNEVQAASVVVPTISHLDVSQALMESGIDVLVEKPLASSLTDADEMVRLAGQFKRVVQVGHLERFNPAVRATVPLVTQPMFFEVHRLSMFSPRSLDVDVVLDLMIHDLDIVLSLARSPVKEIRAVGLPILSRKVDIANVRLEFESGCVANLTASRVSTEQVRKLRFFQPGQYISLDYSLAGCFGLQRWRGGRHGRTIGESADQNQQTRIAGRGATTRGVEILFGVRSKALKTFGFSRRWARGAETGVEYCFRYGGAW